MWLQKWDVGRWGMESLINPLETYAKHTVILSCMYSSLGVSVGGN